VTAPRGPSLPTALIRNLRGGILIHKIPNSLGLFSIEQCPIVASTRMVVMHPAKSQGCARFPIKDVEV
jgi:hypothetical protein